MQNLKKKFNIFLLIKKITQPNNNFFLAYFAHIYVKYTIFCKCKHMFKMISI